MKIIREGVAFVSGAVLCAGILGGITMMQHRETPIPYRSQGVTIPWLPKTVMRFKATIEAQAKAYNIDANAVAILMTLESGGYSKANSGVADGLMQITAPTGKDIAAKYIHHPVASYDLYNADTSIEFGAAFMAHLRDTFCDYTDGPSWSVCMEVVAAGYNGGPGAAISLIKGRGLTDIQTVIYARNAVNMWQERGATSSPTYERWVAAGGQTLLDQAANEAQKF